jgi:hypothetical protein
MEITAKDNMVTPKHHIWSTLTMSRIKGGLENNSGEPAFFCPPKKARGAFML